MGELTYEPLTSEVQTALLAELPGWTIQGGMLTKIYALPSYAAGVMFASSIGHLADQLNHHPDLLILYGKVQVSMITHDAGGLTAYDFELARRIEAIA